MKKLTCMLLALMMLLSVSACGKTGGGSDAPDKPAPSSGESVPTPAGTAYDQITITASNFNPEESSYGQALDAFKAYVEEKSGGVVKVDVYHAGALGTEKECAEGVYEGSIDLMFSGTGGIGNYIPATAAVESWFVIEDIDQLQTTISTLNDKLNTAFDEAGFEYLGCFYDGPRYMCSTKKVSDISGLKGLKWRVPTSTLYIQSVDALGASAISMPLGEVYTSLQTGAIDALEGTLDSIVTYKYYEQADYIVETAHTYQPLFIFYNKANFGALNADTRALIREGIGHAEELQLSAWEANNQTQRDFLERQGVEFVPLTDREKWVDAVKATSHAYGESCGELGLLIYDTIYEIADKK